MSSRTGRVVQTHTLTLTTVHFENFYIFKVTHASSQVHSQLVEQSILTSLYKVTHAQSLRICYIKCDLESTSQSTDSEDRYVAYNLHT